MRPTKLFPLVLVQSLIVLAIIAYQNLPRPQDQSVWSGYITLVLAGFTAIYGGMLLLAAVADRKSTRPLVIVLIIAEGLIALLNRPAFVQLERNSGSLIIHVVTTLAALLVIVAAVIKLRKVGER